MHFCLQDKEQYTALLIRDAAHWAMYKTRGKFGIGAKQLGPNTICISTKNLQIGKI